MSRALYGVGITTSGADSISETIEDAGRLEGNGILDVDRELKEITRTRLCQVFVFALHKLKIPREGN